MTPSVNRTQEMWDELIAGEVVRIKTCPEAEGLNPGSEAGELRWAEAGCVGPLFSL